MERRKFLIGLGALSAGGAAAIGTGAFSNATAERTVSVSTKTDDDAVIGIRPIEEDHEDNEMNIVDEEGDYAEILGDGRLQVEFDELNEGADFTFEDVFVIENNGEREVNLDRVNEDGWSYNDDNSPAHVLVADEVNEFQADKGRETWTEGDGAVLEPGDYIAIGFAFWGEDGVGSYDLEDIPESITFNLGG